MTKRQSTLWDKLYATAKQLAVTYDDLLHQEAQRIHTTLPPEIRLAEIIEDGREGAIEAVLTGHQIKGAFERHFKRCVRRAIRRWLDCKYA